MLKFSKVNKKGVSPLIATVLLIGFMVVLAGVVGTFLITVGEETSKTAIDFVEGTSTCNKITISVEDVLSSGDQIGYNVVNRGLFGVDSIFIRFYYSDNTVGNYQDNFTDRLLPEQSTEVVEGERARIIMKESGKTLTKVDFIPVRDNQGCSDKRIVWDPTVGIVPLSGRGSQSTSGQGGSSTGGNDDSLASS